MRISDIISRLIGGSAPNCPNEADFLAYSENRLSTRNRARIERHFADCDDCRQVLVFLGRESVTINSVNEDVVSQQTARVLAYIETDQRNVRKAPEKKRARSGFYIPFPKLATVGLIIAVIAVGGVLIITRDEAPADAAMVSLSRGMKKMRLSEARISGGFDYSPYAGTTRGGDSGDDDLYLNSAENKVKAAAERENADESDRLVFARVCLARGTRDGALQALGILNRLTKQGIETPEVLNDIGVAHFEMYKYEDAMAFFSKALAKSPNYNEALFNLALTEGLVRRDEDARRDWQKFINQSSDESWKEEAQRHLSAVRDERGR